MDVVSGPSAPLTAGGIVYQVTLASGMIVTSPSVFGGAEYDPAFIKIVVTQDGRVLVAPPLERPPSPDPVTKPRTP